MYLYVYYRVLFCFRLAGVRVLRYSVRGATPGEPSLQAASAGGAVEPHPGRIGVQAQRLHAGPRRDARQLRLSGEDLTGGYGVRAFPKKKKYAQFFRRNFMM